MNKSTLTDPVSLDALRIGTELPICKFQCDVVQLFLYNATLFNAHRIHFDHPYATGEEGYTDLVVAGPLIGDWLHQCVEAWLGDSGQLIGMEYSNRKAVYINEVVSAGGEITAIDTDSSEIELSVFVRDAAGDAVAPGTARVRIGPYA